MAEKSRVNNSFNHLLTAPGGVGRRLKHKKLLNLLGLADTVESFRTRSHH